MAILAIIRGMKIGGEKSAVLAVAVCAYACSAVGAAVPDAASLDHVREEARAFLADDFRRLNMGRATLLEMSERVADLAAAAPVPRGGGKVRRVLTVSAVAAAGAPAEAAATSLGEAGAAS